MAGHVLPGQEGVADDAKHLRHLGRTLALVGGVPDIEVSVALFTVVASDFMVSHPSLGWEEPATVHARMLQDKTSPFIVKH